jgi:hypothetical protein
LSSVPEDNRVKAAPLWWCPKCQRRFANRNQSHACGRHKLVRMSFAVVMPRARWLDGHVVLARRLPSCRFRRIETFSPRNHLHAFRLTQLSDIDEEFVDWLREAYRVGEQRHLGQSPAPGGSR